MISQWPGHHGVRICQAKAKGQKSVYNRLNGPGAINTDEPDRGTLKPGLIFG
jgi:hypothetical protein